MIAIRRWRTIRHHPPNPSHNLAPQPPLLHDALLPRIHHARQLILLFLPLPPSPIPDADLTRHAVKDPFTAVIG